MKMKLLDNIERWYVNKEFKDTILRKAKCWDRLGKIDYVVSNKEILKEIKNLSWSKKKNYLLKNSENVEDLLSKFSYRFLNEIASNYHIYDCNKFKGYSFLDNSNDKYMNDVFKNNKFPNVGIHFKECDYPIKRIEYK